MLTIERETHLAPADASRFAAIYEASFPAWERGDTKELIASIEGGERLSYLARKDDAVIGIAVAFVLKGTSIALLEYLAVDRQHRSDGVGGKLLAHLGSKLAPDSGGAVGMVLEVEPAWEVEGAERELRERRIGFYGRHGAAIVECAPRYRTPNLERAGETVPFTLLWVPLSPGAPATLAGGDLKRCVHAILTQSYELPPGDRLVQEVVDELAC